MKANLYKLGLGVAASVMLFSALPAQAAALGKHARKQRPGTHAADEKRLLTRPRAFRSPYRRL